MSNEKYNVGQRVWWKAHNGREFFFQVREIHPSVEDTYALEAVFSDNCSDVPDNWASARDMRPVEKYDVKCDECKIAIRQTEIVTESYAGGTCESCKAKEAKRRAKNAARRERHAVLTSLGLKRVKGALGGTYYE